MAQWDVHYWTKHINESEYKDLLNFMKTHKFSEAEKYIKGLYTELLEKFPNHKHIFQKMMDRTNPNDFTYIDKDLGGLDINILLYETWELVKKYDSYEEFIETIQEIDQHCIQGDSHRLWTFFIALYNS